MADGWGVWVLGGGHDAPHTLPPSPTVGRPGAFGDHAACPCKPPGHPDALGLARCFLGGPVWHLSPRFSSLPESASAAGLAGQQGVCVKVVLVLVILS